MKKAILIIVFGLLLGSNAFAKTTTEYLGDDVWLVKYDEGCTYND